MVPGGADVQSFYAIKDMPLTGLACHGTACFVARHLHASRWQQAEEQSTRVHCFGHCHEGPANADSSGWPQMGVSSAHSIVLKRLIRGGTKTLEAYRKEGGYQALEQALTRSPESCVETLERSELRGRGGAGFPVGRKWRAAAQARSSPKVLIANADEGDAGAYIDRCLLERDPHAILEGMSIAAHAIGANQGWIYLRREYSAARSSMESALEELRQEGMVGPDAFGVGRPWDIQLHSGGGSYVCGEETALIQALEGKRPQVMARPPYATEHGLWRCPTVMQNVETLVNIPWIVQNGAEAYRTLGFSKSRGTKVLSLNSLFCRPGLYEVEFGIPLRRVVEDLGGGLIPDSRLKGVLLGGPLAGVLPPSVLDVPLGFEELRAVGGSLGHGGMVAFDQHTSVLELLHQVFAFAAAESCGKCTPCRLGSRRLERVLSEAVNVGATRRWNAQDCEAVIHALRWSSLCGFGVGLAEFAQSILRHYRKELEPCLK